MRLDASRRELHFKIVYCGPGLAGKSTNLEHLLRSYPLVPQVPVLPLEGDATGTMSVEPLSLRLGRIGTYTLCFDLLTGSGHTCLASQRRELLDGVDGIVFVADSDPRRELAGVQARVDLAADLDRTGRDLSRIPHVYQWNKQDLPDALPPRLLRRVLNPEGAPELPAVAREGVGVLATHAAIVKRVTERVRAAIRDGGALHG